MHNRKTEWNERLMGPMRLCGVVSAPICDNSSIIGLAYIYQIYMVSITSVQYNTIEYKSYLCEARRPKAAVVMTTATTTEISKTKNRCCFKLWLHQQHRLQMVFLWTHTHTRSHIHGDIRV